MNFSHSSQEPGEDVVLLEFIQMLPSEQGDLLLQLVDQTANEDPAFVEAAMVILTMGEVSNIVAYNESILKAICEANVSSQKTFDHHLAESNKDIDVCAKGITFLTRRRAFPFAPFYFLIRSFHPVLFVFITILAVALPFGGYHVGYFLSLERSCMATLDTEKDALIAKAHVEGNHEALEMLKRLQDVPLNANGFVHSILTEARP